MWLFKSRSHCSPEKLAVATTMFIGEQDGSSERELKGRLVALFDQVHLVRRAYLARVKYGDAQSVVALCMCGKTGHERLLAKQVGQVFGSLFSNHEHLDVIWLKQDQEVELARVCSAFYNVDAKQP